VTINFKERANFIWSIADLLRGDYKQSEYGRVILPLTVLRRLDCVLEPTKEAVFARSSPSQPPVLLRHCEERSDEAISKRQAAGKPNLSWYRGVTGNTPPPTESGGFHWD